MAVTSQVRAAMGETLIEQWSEAGLAKPSVIKPVIATIERSLILKELGTLQMKDANELKRTISLIFN